MFYNEKKSRQTTKKEQTEVQRGLTCLWLHNKLQNNDLNLSSLILGTWSELFPFFRDQQPEAQFRAYCHTLRSHLVWPPFPEYWKVVYKAGMMPGRGSSSAPNFTCSSRLHHRMACLALQVLTSAGPALPDKLFPLTIHLLLLYKTRSWGFPDGPVVKNIHLPMQRTWVQSLLWEILHTMEQLSPCATASEPARLEPVLHNKRGHCNEKSNSHLLQLEKTWAQQQSPNTAKNKSVNKYYLKKQGWTTWPISEVLTSFKML